MTRVAACAGLSACLCASALSASPRRVSAPPHAQIFRATADTVAVYATVRDRDGKLVLGLTQDDFEILDSGKPRPISVFSNAKQPITIGLLLDRSGSMSDRFEKVAAAASAFVDKLDGPDRASLSTLNWDCSPLTTDRSRLKGILGEIMPGDFGSAIWDGLDRVLATLQPEPGRRAALLFSDGLNSGVSLLTREVYGAVAKNGCKRVAPVSDALLTDLSRRADREGFLIYAISAGTLDGGGDGALRALARDSGGERFRLESDDELQGAFTRIADELHHQYLLGFVPAVFDGKTHQIEVRVKGDGREVRARQRYVAVREGETPLGVDAPIAIPPLDDAQVLDAMTQGLQNKRLQAVCRTSPLSDAGVTPVTYAEVTLEGPVGGIMRAAREARLARQLFTSSNVTPEMRAPVLRVRAGLRTGVFLDEEGEQPSAGRLQRPLQSALSVRLRSVAPPMQLLLPLPVPSPRAFSAPALTPEARFDLAEFRALPAGEIEAIVDGVGKTAGRCRISARDRAAIR